MGLDVMIWMIGGQVKLIPTLEIRMGARSLVSQKEEIAWLVNIPTISTVNLLEFVFITPTDAMDIPTQVVVGMMSVSTSVLKITSKGGL